MSFSWQDFEHVEDVIEECSCEIVSSIEEGFENLEFPLSFKSLVLYPEPYFSCYMTVNLVRGSSFDEVIKNK